MLAVLSYHSWEVSVDTLAEDVRALRHAGWRTVTAREALGYVRGDIESSAQCVLISTDDGHVEDEEWADALARLECPAVTFVCSALVPPERLAFYRQHASSEEFAVEDHGARHEQHASSSRVLGYVATPTPARARPGIVHAPGEPILATASIVATRRFDPDPDAIALLVAAGRSATADEIRSSRWQLAIEGELLRRRLAVRRLGRLFIRGRFESRDEYRTRVDEYFRVSRAVFERRFGRPPSLYAYTWWAGNSITDDMLRRIGYEGSFRGTGALQRDDRRTFGIPRIPVGASTPRPLDLDGLPRRSVLPKLELELFRAAGKRLLGIG